jgi:hypothetical protein
MPNSNEWDYGVIYVIETGKSAKPGEPHTVGWYLNKEDAEKNLPAVQRIWPTAYIWDYPIGEPFGYNTI